MASAHKPHPHRALTGLRASSRTGVIKLQVSDSVCFCAMTFAVSFVHCPWRPSPAAAPGGCGSCAPAPALPAARFICTLQ
eukprot:3853021-Prymnesium_polylepis.1